jgi:hypothetical protein
MLKRGNSDTSARLTDLKVCSSRTIAKIKFSKPKLMFTTLARKIKLERHST